MKNINHYNDNDMTRIIAVCNHKGGIGKTTSVAAIGAALAAAGKRTLLIDLDAQANLTASFLSDEQERSIYNALTTGGELPTLSIRENLSIVPSNLDMAGVELDLASRISREYILAKLLKQIKDNYDFILLDCPPSLGLVTINALVAATELFIPLTAEALPSKGLAKLTNILAMVRDNLNENIKLSGVIITRWENTKLSQMVEEQIRSAFGSVLFNTKIRKNVAIAEAPLFSKDVITYDRTSNGAKDYIALTQEILQRYL